MRTRAHRTMLEHLPSGELVEAIELLGVRSRPGALVAERDLVFRLTWWLVVHGRGRA